MKMTTNTQRERTYQAPSEDSTRSRSRIGSTFQAVGTCGACVARPFVHFLLCLFLPVLAQAQYSFSLVNQLTTSEFSIPGPIIEGSDGMLYGIVFDVSDEVFPTAGRVYRVRKDGTEFQIIFDSFGAFTNGYVFPELTVYEAGNGKLLGFALHLHGDANDPSFGGTLLYRMNKDGSSVEVLRRFPPDPTTGAGFFPGPFSFESPDGWLYGSHSEGIFRCRLDGSQFAILHNFGSVTNDGSSPGRPILASDGRVYGPCSGGGRTSRGTIYRMEPDGSDYRIIHHFDIALERVAYPTWLMEDASGALVCYSGQVGGPAWLFKINKDGAGLATKLLDLRLATHGVEGASGALTMGADGFLYGRTRAGGTSTPGCDFYGTVFRVRPDGTGFKVIYRVGTTSPQDCGAAEVGESLYEPLIVSRDGSIYGKGGSCCANTSQYIFRLSPPRLQLSATRAADVLRLTATGTTNTQWRLESRDSVSGTSAWQPLTNITLGPSPTVIQQPLGGTDRFYRGTWLP